MTGDELIGKTIRSYDVVEIIQQRNEATIYRAHQPQLKLDVALAVLGREWGQNKRFVELFEQQMGVLGKIQHTHLIGLYDFGVEDEQPYFIMRLVRGDSLRGRLKGGALTPVQAGRIVQQLAGALDYAHANGVTSLNLDPTDILIDDGGNAYISPHSMIATVIARATVEDGGSVTQTGRAAPVNPLYLSPEQIQRLASTEQSDQYALGLIAYEMLTGKPPFGIIGGETPMSLMTKHLTTPLPDASATGADLPADVDAVLQKAAAKTPAERYESAGDFAEALTGIFMVAGDTGMMQPVVVDSDDDEPAEPPAPPPKPPAEINLGDDRTLTEEFMPSDIEEEVDDEDGFGESLGGSEKFDQPWNQPDTGGSKKEDKYATKEYEKAEESEEEPPEPKPAPPVQVDPEPDPDFDIGQPAMDGQPGGSAEAPETSAAPLQVVQFSGFYPRRLKPVERAGLYVYAHIPAMLPTIKQDAQKFKDELGGRVPEPTVARQISKLRVGTLVTIEPECDGMEFDPPLLTKKWNGEWVRFGFDVSANELWDGQTAPLRVSVQVSGVEIAHIDCPIQIGGQAADLNPLAQAKEMVSQTAYMYQKIFISYSRKDTPVAEAYRQAQLAAGHEVFMDSYSIRSGENWQAALARGIDEADFLQLFWSRNSSQSEACRDEWQYALSNKCRDDGCAQFIRPVYWAKALPVMPPPELQHLNFKFIPLAAAGTIADRLRAALGGLFGGQKNFRKHGES
jgi:serine/threonine-protein kinase